MHGQQGPSRMQGSHRCFCSLLETRFMAPILIPRKSNVELGTLQTINRGSTVQAWLEAAARHNARVQSLESSYGSYGLSAAPMLRSFSLLGKTSYLPLAEDSWLSEIRIGPLNKAENHNGVRVQGIK